MIQKESANQVNSISLSLQGLVFGMILIFPALLSMDVLGGHITLSFLPVAAVYLWPRAASYSWSLPGIFLIGLSYDMASASPMGMWTLAFLILFVVLGGGIAHPGGLSRAVGGFSLSVLLCFIVVLIVGRLFMGQWPHIFTLLANAVASIIIFPIIYWIRSMLMIMRGQQDTLGLRE